ncbi:hypothetical protein [Streptomyces sp. TLI_185]|uniref:hypothetical protein n=1 Tax=Streptomyces sp. TLI_185 TaxID=2485151 RepID=UPI000F4F2E85|nr:hypothetical protein [Streptomyces sp. TLI_185]RPF32861.1 hypothetical protein EDD92_2756 [Streptomyces sp. TLI_185]
MADPTAFYSVISGIGGALIGGVAGVYGPVRIDKRRREHELHIENLRREFEIQAQARAADLEARRLRDEANAREQAIEAERRRLRAEEDARKKAASQEESEKVLAAIADATVALQDWHRLIARTLQDLAAEREVNVAEFDESAEPVMHSVAEAISLVSNRSFRSVRQNGHTGDPSGDADGRQPVTLAMQQVTLELRRQLLAPQSGLDVGDSITARTDTIRDDLMRVFRAERELQVGPPIEIDRILVLGDSG